MTSDFVRLAKNADDDDLREWIEWASTELKTRDARRKDEARERAQEILNKDGRVVVTIEPVHRRAGVARHDDGLERRPPQFTQRRNNMLAGIAAAPLILQRSFDDNAPRQASNR